MGVCNWGLMACHHKVCELIRKTHLVDQKTTCHYHPTTNGNYEQLLKVVGKYGTLGIDAPRATTKRGTLLVSYHSYKQSPDTYLAWLADAVRELLNPANLRRMVDFVHYEWNDQIGDAGYCP